MITNENTIIIEGYSLEELKQFAKEKAKLDAEKLEAETHHENQENIHRNTVLGWIKKTMATVLLAYVSIFIIQSAVSGFDKEMILEGINYVTKPISLIIFVGFSVSCLIWFLFKLFPILAIYINEKVNTATLSKDFIDSKPEIRMNFLAKIILALSLLIGLAVNVKGQSRDCIIQTASKEIGVLEIGTNQGKQIDLYRSVAMGRTVKNEKSPWCAYFVAYVLKSCGVKFNVSNVGRARAYFEDKTKIIYKKGYHYGVIKPRILPTDLIGYRFASGEISHIGINKYWSWDLDEFRAIEGNTSNKQSVYRDLNFNDGVRLKNRKISQASIVSRHT